MKICKAYDLIYLSKCDIINSPINKNLAEDKRMITIFNRKELLVTLDTKRYSNVSDILSANGIDYTVKVTNRQASSVVGSNRARVGSFGMNQNLAYEYKIYVHKKDYDNALRLIR